VAMGSSGIASEHGKKHSHVAASDSAYMCLRKRQVRFEAHVLLRPAKNVSCQRRLGRRAVMSVFKEEGVVRPDQQPSGRAYFF
jgi:hypothetical protein